MSEHQFYEFRKLAGTLDDEAMKEVSALSSRAQVTRTSASFVYHYGDFRGRPLAVLADHFDIMLYLANWGTQWLALRLPASAVNCEAFLAFAMEDSIVIEDKGEHLIVSASFNEEEGWIDVEGEGAMDRIVALYDELLAGDYRSLFLLWLRGMALRPVADWKVAVPPIPPGLGTLSKAQVALIEIFQIDQDLVSASAAFSAPAGDESEKALQALEAVPVAAQTEYLRRMLLGEHPSHVVAELRAMLRESGRRTAATPQKSIRASVFFEAASRILESRTRKEMEKRATEERKRLEEIERNEDRLWGEVDRLIADRNTKSYDAVVGILQQLRDLATHKALRPDFARRVEDLRDRYSRLTGLKSRIDQGDLL